METVKTLMRKSGLILILFLVGFSGYSVKAPFNKGVNLTGWFQADSPKQIQFTKFTHKDFVQIKSLGCDVIRLPINLHYMTSGSPDYTINPLFYSFLDQVVNWCEELEINLILDNHTFDVTADTDPLVETILEKVWSQMAAHYLDASTLIFFEILNEPHGIADNTWNTIQQNVITAIRKVDTKHTIIVGPASWNSYNNLNNMPVYSDKNLIYTFHFYDPFLFTHQGASWTDLTPVSGVPFPYDASNMPACPAELKGTWVESSFHSYPGDGTVSKVKALIDIAVNFAIQRNVPIYCGEFGVYDLNSPADDRVYWYNIVRNYLEEKGIAWTIWDYQGSFGLFNKNSYSLFDHDLNVPLLEALGLTVPEQTPYVQTADSIGFNIYDDNIGEKIVDQSYNPGDLNFYSTDHPNRGNYCIEWSSGVQYQSIVFDFIPDKDLSFLKDNGYALSVIAKSDNPDGQFDIRFIDTKTDDPEDHPWRMRTTINKTILPGDNLWHKLYLPLSGFLEHGSWDNNAWYNPEGKFDWKAIGRLEIDQEYEAMGDYKLWLDDMVITNQDTLKVADPFGRKEFNKLSDFVSVQVLEARHKIVLKNSLTGETINYHLVDVTGKIRASGQFSTNMTIETYYLNSGLYLLYLDQKDNGKLVKKVLLY